MTGSEKRVWSWLGSGTQKEKDYKKKANDAKGPTLSHSIAGFTLKVLVTRAPLPPARILSGNAPPHLKLPLTRATQQKAPTESNGTCYVAMTRNGWTCRPGIPWSRRIDGSDHARRAQTTSPVTNKKRCMNYFEGFVIKKWVEVLRDEIKRILFHVS